MSTSIFIRSCARDAEFLDYLLRSLAKFARGFTEIVVAVPEYEKDRFVNRKFHGAKGICTKEPKGKGPLFQQRDKLHADEFCSGDFIFYVDSDCFMLRETGPEEFFVNGRPMAMIRRWEDAGPAIVWKSITEAFLQFPTQFETMCNMPMLLDRRSLPMIREYGQRVHNLSVDEYILRQPIAQFSEFNVALNYAMRFCPHFYHWQLANWKDDGFPRDSIVQQWSYNPNGVNDFAPKYEEVLAQ